MKIVMPAAAQLLRSVGDRATGNLDLASLKRAFPGCPFNDTAYWSVGNVLCRYYGLKHMNDLPKERRIGVPYVSYLVRYARHFVGDEDFSDYEHYYLDPAREHK